MTQYSFICKYLILFSLYLFFKFENREKGNVLYKIQNTINIITSKTKKKQMNANNVGKEKMLKKQNQKKKTCTKRDKKKKEKKTRGSGSHKNKLGPFKSHHKGKKNEINDAWNQKTK